MLRKRKQGKELRKPPCGGFGIRYTFVRWRGNGYRLSAALEIAFF
jgi:hypothetical protein